MEPTTIDLSDVIIENSRYGKPLVRISQDHDLIVVEEEDIEEFVAAVRKHANIIEEPEPPSEMWYVVLRHSNLRLTNHKGEPTIFTDYDAAKRYGVQREKVTDRWYLPISVDNYERVFGR